MDVRVQVLAYGYVCRWFEFPHEQVTYEHSSACDGSSHFSSREPSVTREVPNFIHAPKYTSQNHVRGLCINYQTDQVVLVHFEDLLRRDGPPCARILDHGILIVQLGRRTLLV